MTDIDTWLQKLKDEDPIKRMVEKESGLNELSPMDPPDAFKPPTVDAIPYGELSPVLQKLMDEHKLFTSELDEFEKMLIAFKKNGWKLNKDIEKRFSGNITSTFTGDSIMRAAEKLSLTTRILSLENSLCKYFFNCFR